LSSSGIITYKQQLPAGIMSSTIDDLTVSYEEDGVQVTKETGKEILSKGAWTTILFRYQTLDKASGEFGKSMYTIPKRALI
jgi:hypothetical protein